MLRKVAEVPTLSRSLFLSTMGVSYCNPLNRTRSAGWFRVERIALPQQRCRKAKWVERGLVLRGPSLVEALLPSTCVTLGREGATRGFVYSSAKQDQTGSSDRFARVLSRPHLAQGRGVTRGSKTADTEMGESSWPHLPSQPWRITSSCSTYRTSPVATAGRLDPLCHIPGKWPFSLRWDRQWRVSDHRPEGWLPSGCSNLRKAGASARVRIYLPVAFISWS